MRPDITILGLGMAPDQLTLEAREAMAASNEVLYLDTGPGTHALIEALGPVATPLYSSHYVVSGGRLDSYRRMAIQVIEAALDRAPVCFAHQGHPLVFVYSPFLVRDMAALLGLSVQVLPGISSMAALLCELMLDPGTNGILAYEATDLLLRRRTLLPDVPTLLWQVGSIETRLHTDRLSRPERLSRLAGLLRQHYPADHPITSVHLGPHPLIPTERTTFPLSELEERAPELHRGVTLYLPPAVVRPILDADLLARIDSRAHLHAITEERLPDHR